MTVRSGRSAAWLARVPWEHEVAGSNPAAPTILLRSASLALGRATEDWRPPVLAGGRAKEMVALRSPPPPQAKEGEVGPQSLNQRDIE